MLKQTTNMSESGNEAKSPSTVGMKHLIVEVKKLNMFEKHMSIKHMTEILESVEELKRRQLYEDGMKRQDVINTLAAVKDSEESASQGSQSKDINKSPEMMRANNRASNSRESYSRSSDRDSMSPEMAENSIKMNLSQGRRNDSDDDAMYSSQKKKFFNKDNKDFQSFNMNRNYNTINENPSESNDNKNVSSLKSNLLQRSNEPHKSIVNPLDVIDNPKDVPLRSRFQEYPEKDKSAFVSVEKVVTALANHLQQVAEQYYNPYENTNRYSAPWGKAIQVGSDNGSMNRNRIRDDYEFKEDVTSADTNENIEIDRLLKRRSCTIKAVKYNADDFDTEDNSDDDFVQPMNSKRRQTKRADSCDRTTNENIIADKTRPKRPENINDTDDRIDNELIIEENYESDSEQRDHKKKATKRAVSSEENNHPWESIIDEHDTDDERETSAKKMKKSNSSDTIERVSTNRNNRQNNAEPASNYTIDRETDAFENIEEGDDVAMIYDEEKSRRPQKTLSNDNETLKKSEKNVSEENEASTSSIYPRRIVPPPLKKKFMNFVSNLPIFNNFQSTVRTKKIEIVTEEPKNSKSRTNVNLDESEILEALESNDDVEEITTETDVVEIRPLRMRVSKGMKYQAELLKKQKKEMEEQELKAAEEKRLREEENDRVKQLRIQQRVQESNTRIRNEKLKAKATAESEKQWKRQLDQQTTRKHYFGRTELNPEGPRQNNDLPNAEIEQSDFQTEADEEQRRVSCPICYNKFLASQIEDHAASCVEYDASSAGPSRPGSPTPGTRVRNHLARNASNRLICETCRKFSTLDRNLYEDHINRCIPPRAINDSSVKFDCEVCSNFSTYNGIDYEDHVNTCLVNRVVNETGRNAIDVPDSPVRTFRRISELTDSEIEFNNAFVPRTRSQVTDCKKRKRN